VLGYANVGLTLLGIVAWIFLFLGAAILGNIVPSISPTP
jgi:hypothetical protein